MFTHFVFGMGTVAVLGEALLANLGLRLSLALVLSFGVNIAIDELGHVTRGGFVSRSPVTHSMFTAPIWGGAVGYFVWWAGVDLGLAQAGLEWASILLGISVAAGHLFLDSLTERGVFVFTHRIGIAHFRSRNFLLNGAFVLAGFALLALGSAG